ncbi:VIP36-like protein [Trichonephila clavipes]|nr:VIP36-like protein [Trichonephila clavipes]
MLKHLRFNIFELQEKKLLVRLINTTNEWRLVQGHETTPLRMKGDIEDVYGELDNGGQSTFGRNCFPHPRKERIRKTFLIRLDENAVFRAIPIWRTIDDRTDTMRTSLKFLTIFSAFLCFLTTEAILVRQESSMFGPYDAGNAHLAHWDLSGTAHLAETAIRLTPDEASAQGAIWNNYPLMSNDWEFHIQFHIHGKGVHLNGNGMAFWYAKEPLTPGHVFGSKDYFSGLGIFIDTVENAAAPHNHRHPYLSAVVNNGSFPYHHDEQGTAGQIGGCHLQARNLEWPTKLAISYISDVLTVYLDTQGTETWTQCFRAVGVHLPTGYFLGASASTGEHSDNHDIVSITTLDNIIPEKVWEDRNLLIPHAEFLEIPFVEATAKAEADAAGSDSLFGKVVYFGGIAVVLYFAYVIFKKYKGKKDRKHRS